MRLLLGSGGFRTPERLARLTEKMKDHFGAIQKILFIPYALHDHDGYVEMMTREGFNAGYPLEGIHRAPNPVQAVEQAEGIFMGGGNTFRLVTNLHQLGLIEPIRRRVQDGMPYMGVSAGTNVSCPTLMTTNDMPIVQPPSFDTLNLIPFQINPHYFNGQVHVQHGDDMVPHFGETRDDRIREFHEMNDRVVVGLWEGGILMVENGSVTLHAAPARIFHKGQEPVDVEPGAKLDDLITG